MCLDEELDYGDYISQNINLRLIVFAVLLVTIIPFLFSALKESYAQTASVNILTYTNADCGFTLKYPSNWNVNEVYLCSDIQFKSPDNLTTVFVDIENTTSEMRMSHENPSSWISQPPQGMKIMEFNQGTYFLGGHPAIRFIASFSQPQNTEMKAMLFETIIADKMNRIMYLTPTEKFLENLDQAQMMMDSFQSNRQKVKISWFPVCTNRIFTKLIGSQNRDNFDSQPTSTIVTNDLQSYSQ